MQLNLSLCCVLFTIFLSISVLCFNKLFSAYKLEQQGFRVRKGRLIKTVWKHPGKLVFEEENLPIFAEIGHLHHLIVEGNEWMQNSLKERCFIASESIGPAFLCHLKQTCTLTSK